MDLRESKGIQIATTSKILESYDGWTVPSQTSNRKYFVRKNAEMTCSCLDCKNRKVKCKHAFAVQFYLQKITRTEQGVKVETKRLTYPQAWSAYNKSQETEKTRFLELLNDLIEPAETLEKRGRGQPKTSDHDLLFASALKVYSQFSLRRFMSDLEEAHKKGFIQKKPCFASVGHFMQKQSLAPQLKELISCSASVLKSVETSFAIDSTGFRTTRFNDYCREKHGEPKQHVWLKLHAVIGTKTNAITACEITDNNAGDSKFFTPLMQETHDNGFNIQEATADKAYSSRDNYALIESFGGTAYIPYRNNASGKPRGKSHIWRKMFHYFQYNRDEFLKHYHARSNAETTFMALKTKFNDCLKSKTKNAQINELLLKVLCFNIVQVIHETNELGINAQFGSV